MGMIVFTKAYNEDWNDDREGCLWSAGRIVICPLLTFVLCLLVDWLTKGGFSLFVGPPLSAAVFSLASVVGYTVGVRKKRPQLFP